MKNKIAKQKNLALAVFSLFLLAETSQTARIWAVDSEYTDPYQNSGVQKQTEGLSVEEMGTLLKCMTEYTIGELIKNGGSRQVSQNQSTSYQREETEQDVERESRDRETETLDNGQGENGQNLDIIQTNKLQGSNYGDEGKAQSKGGEQPIFCLTDYNNLVDRMSQENVNKLLKEIGWTEKKTKSWLSLPGYIRYASDDNWDNLTVNKIIDKINNLTKLNKMLKEEDKTDIMNDSRFYDGFSTAWYDVRKSLKKMIEKEGSHSKISLDMRKLDVIINTLIKDQDADIISAKIYSIIMFRKELDINFKKEREKLYHWIDSFQRDLDKDLLDNIYWKIGGNEKSEEELKRIEKSLSKSEWEEIMKDSKLIKDEKKRLEEWIQQDRSINKDGYESLWKGIREGEEVVEDGGEPWKKTIDLMKSEDDKETNVLLNRIKNLMKSEDDKETNVLLNRIKKNEIPANIDKSIWDSWKMSAAIFLRITELEINDIGVYLAEEIGPIEESNHNSEELFEKAKKSGVLSFMIKVDEDKNEFYRQIYGLLQGTEFTEEKSEFIIRIGKEAIQYKDIAKVLELNNNNSEFQKKAKINKKEIKEILKEVVKKNKEKAKNEDGQVFINQKDIEGQIDLLFENVYLWGGETEGSMKFKEEMWKTIIELADNLTENELDKVDTGICEKVTNLCEEWLEMVDKDEAEKVVAASKKVKTTTHGGGSAGAGTGTGKGTVDPVITTAVPATTTAVTSKIMTAPATNTTTPATQSGAASKTADPEITVVPASQSGSASSGGASAGTSTKSLTKKKGGKKPQGAKKMSKKTKRIAKKPKGRGKGKRGGSAKKKRLRKRG